MSNSSLKYLFGFSILFSLICVILSLGWMIIIFGLIFLAQLILHWRTGVVALRKESKPKLWLIISNIALILFFLLRPDFNDSNAYNAATSILYMMGLKKSNAIFYEGTPMVISSFFFILNVSINLLIVSAKFFKSIGRYLSSRIKLD